jgi:hypothetical protein
VTIDSPSVAGPRQVAQCRSVLVLAFEDSDELARTDETQLVRCVTGDPATVLSLTSTSA